LLLLLLATNCAAAEEVDVGADGSSAARTRAADHDDDGVVADVAQRLHRDGEGAFTEKEAEEVAALLSALGEGEETTKLVREMTQGSGVEHFSNLAGNGGGTSKRQVALSLYASYKVMKVVDEIFTAEPEQAFVELVKEGLVDAKLVDTYADDPKKLEDDTKRALLFKFVALAAVGGYL